MKIMFMGTPEFAVSSLISLKDAGYTVDAIITQPDKPRGRGHKICHTPVCEYGHLNNIKVYQPVNLKRENFEKILTDVNPDIIIVTAYGKILPEYVLNYPKHGCINVHASLLPKYRGAAPIQRCLIDGEKVTGISIMYMEKGLDTGDVILQKEVCIECDDNFQTLHDKLADAGKVALIDAIKMIESGNVTRQKQDDDLSCYAQMIDKSTAKINWHKSAQEIACLVRGLYPFPKAYTYLDGKILKITHAVHSDEDENAEVGRIVSVLPKSFKVKCDKGLLEVFGVQLEGKKCMSVYDFLKGYKLLKNAKLE